MQLRLTRPAAFVVAGATSVFMLAGSAAPSPLYPVYQQLWGFSSGTLTLVFAVYVVALLLALLTVGSLSDHLGRRPVAIGGLLVLAGAMALFAMADGTSTLFVARILQGLATGAMTGTVTALVVDQQPHPRAGSLVSSASPATGLAAGAIAAGALVQWAPDPRRLVFWLLLASYLVLAALVWFVPEAERRSSGSVWRSLRPGVSVPATARSRFLAVSPALCATWALAGLYLSLGASVAGGLLGVRDHFVAGLLIAAMFAAGAVGSAAFALFGHRLGSRTGFGALATGLTLTGVAVVLGSLPLYAVGSAVAGLGFGGTFVLVIGSLTAVVEPHERAGLFASMFVLSYVAFSVPAVIAGYVSESAGLRPTVLTYAAVDLALVALAAALSSREARTAALAEVTPLGATAQCAVTEARRPA